MRSVLLYLPTKGGNVFIYFFLENVPNAMKIYIIMNITLRSADKNLFVSTKQDKFGFK